MRANRWTLAVLAVLILAFGLNFAEESRRCEARHDPLPSQMTYQHGCLVKFRGVFVPEQHVWDKLRSTRR